MDFKVAALIIDRGQEKKNNNKIGAYFPITYIFILFRGKLEMNYELNNKKQLTLCLIIVIKIKS